MSLRTCALLILLGALSGCATSGAEQVLVQRAWQEREAAYSKLAQAMTDLCSVKHPSLEARHHCIVEQRMALMRIRKANEATTSGVSPMAGSYLGQGHGEGTTPLLRCEGVGLRATCHHSAPAFASLGGG